MENLESGRDQDSEQRLGDGTEIGDGPLSVRLKLGSAWEVASQQSCTAPLWFLRLVQIRESTKKKSSFLFDGKNLLFFLTGEGEKRKTFRTHRPFKSAEGEEIRRRRLVAPRQTQAGCGLTAQSLSLLVAGQGVWNLVVDGAESPTACLCLCLWLVGYPVFARWTPVTMAQAVSR